MAVGVRHRDAPMRVSTEAGQPGHPPTRLARGTEGRAGLTQYGAGAVAGRFRGDRCGDQQHRGAVLLVDAAIARARETLRRGETVRDWWSRASAG